MYHLLCALFLPFSLTGLVKDEHYNNAYIFIKQYCRLIFIRLLLFTIYKLIIKSHSNL